MSSRLRESLAEHQRVVAAAANRVGAAMGDAVRRVGECIESGGRVWTMGNGGSAAQAQHVAAELVGHFERERPGWPAVALTADTSTLTSITNDFGFEQVFARQVRAMARPGDVVVALSTSGDSPNVVEGAVAAQSLGCAVVGMTGEHGGRLAGSCDVLLEVPSQNVARIQEVHQLYVHLLVEGVEDRLLGTRAETGL